jgi:hypothetical protein
VIPDDTRTTDMVLGDSGFCSTVPLSLEESYVSKYLLPTREPVLRDRYIDKHERIGMIDKGQLRDLITRVLQDADLYSDSAVELLMLTAAVESKLGTYIKQVKGPALGVFQMEPATYEDIWANFLSYKPGVERRLYIEQGGEQLEYDIRHAILMARIHYLRVKSPLPAADDVDALAAYWKTYYNTHLGKGTVAKAKAAYERYC